MAESIEALQEAKALKEKPSEEYLDEIIKEVGSNWKRLLRHLGVPNVRIDLLLEANYGNPTKACFKGLVFWREGNKPCKPSTWSVLLEALEKGAEKREYAKKLREKIVNITCTTMVKQRPPTPLSQQRQTLRMSAMNKKSTTKFTEILDMFRKGKLSLPSNPKLKKEFDEIMGKLNAILLSADIKVINKLHGIIQMKYRRILHGDRQKPLPEIPDTAKGLYEFIAEKSTPYEILMLHPIVDELDCPQLKKDFQRYESDLDKYFLKTFRSYKRQRVTLSHPKDHTHMAVVISDSEEQVLLSLMLEMKQYFYKNLQLELALFEGFEEGCIVLSFSIPRADARQLSPMVLEYHSSELKRMFGMTHLIVFGYFACDLENDTVDQEIFKLPAVYKDELRLRISLYVQAARDLVQHRDQGMAWFREAADDLDKAFKRVAAAKIVGSSLGVAGGILSVVGGGLILGGVTAPAGIPILAVGAALGVGGGITGVGATIGDIVENRRALKRANEWIREGSELCKDLIKKHDDYRKKLNWIMQEYWKSEEEVIEITIGSIEKRSLEIKAHEFHIEPIRKLDTSSLIGTEHLKWEQKLQPLPLLLEHVLLEQSLGE